jgi:hypothetical protein
VDDYDEDEPTGDLQMLVNEDTQRIMAYGHAGEYGGSWLNRADRIYGVSFTASLEQHEAPMSRHITWRRPLGADLATGC